MRVLSIPQWSSEPHSQWQNPAERHIQYVKQVANTVMDMTNAPSETWLHCLIYVCFVLNHLYDASIGAVPLTALNGVSVDISVLLRFTFWERVYYAEIDPGFPSDSREAIGYILGISEHVGNAMCYMICNPVTKAILHHSRCCPIPPDDPNYRAESVVGEKISNPNSRSTIKSLSTSNGEGNNQSDTENGEQTEEQQDNPNTIACLENTPSKMCQLLLRKETIQSLTHPTCLALIRPNSISHSLVRYNGLSLLVGLM